jgi:colanic acid/amylovoran biosynthesis glycosyltransferase
MTSTADPTELILLPSLRAHRGPQGGLVMTQKYMNGAAAFARRWPGPVTSLVTLDSMPSSDMDHIEVTPGAFETELELRPTDPAALEQRLAGAAMVLGFLSRFEAPTAQMCRRMGVPIAFTSEYTPRTERQIVDADTANPVLRLRRKLWIARTEYMRRKALRIAAGLQCNGTPTYDIYRGLNPHTLLFFDNRVPKAALISDAAFAAKSEALQAGRPLRLIFGGRLIAMKGALELPKVAAELRKRRVPFTLDIYGKGDLEETLVAQIASLGLSDHVVLHGPLDFEGGWIPTLRDKADLFVCCHVQGDPSGTYPEVLSCGVPIVGYDNEALRGAVVKSSGGWATPMHDVGALADRIAALDGNRPEMIRAAAAGRSFGRAHTFEPTMDRRAAHLVQASRLSAARKAQARSGA